jgi:glucokinase
MTSADSTHPLLVGIDLGATNYRVAVARGDSIVERITRQTPQAHTGQEITDALLDTVDGVLADADVDQSALDGAGVGSIGPLDADGGVVIDPPNLPDSIEGIPLAGPLRDHLGVPVSVENDAIAALLAERASMEDPPADMAYVTFSTGVGAGVAVDGHVLRGWGGNAAEVGHFVLDPESELECGCGRPGHWEAFAGGNNIPDHARSLTDFFEGETDLPLDSPDFTAADVFDAAGDDVLADILVHRLERWNALGLANLTHAFAPERISIGGAVALRNPRLVIDPLRDRLPDLVTTRVPEIRETPLGEDAVLRGGLELARQAAGGDAP